MVLTMAVHQYHQEKLHWPARVHLNSVTSARETTEVNDLIIVMLNVDKSHIQLIRGDGDGEMGGGGGERQTETETGGERERRRETDIERQRQRESDPLE